MITPMRALELPGTRTRFHGSAGWVAAVAETARPRQWPKNLLVFAAPLAGASLGRDEGFGYALGAAAAFIAASIAVYFVNDVIDARRDRLHPVKRFRAVASGRLPASHALVLGAVIGAVAMSYGFWFGQPGLAALITGYLALSLLYGLVLKHVAGVEMVFVASGFVLRALGGAVATAVSPSAWFLLVCSLGALMVTIAKRYAELSALGEGAAAHRPVMRWYAAAWLRRGQRLAAIVMLAAYLIWAASQSNAWMRAWHLASTIPLAAAVVRFSWLTRRAGTRPVEDLIVRDRLMACAELGWLLMFTAGL
ncbi:MAG: decaprenyl-phosphate phosphoribosyltransferase [Streptosporangiaceae bacterium]